MLKRSNTTIVIVVLVVLLVALTSVVAVLGYQLIYPRLVKMGLLSSQVEAPLETDILPSLPIETQGDAPMDTLQPTIPVSLAEVGTATPTEEQVPTEGPVTRYPGFDTMVTLPDNVLLPGQEDDSGVINTLTIAAMGGGDPCEGFPTASIEAESGRVLLCNYIENETVTIELVQPDGTVARSQATLPYETYNYCFGRGLTLSPGSYQVRVTSDTHPVRTDSFQVQASNLPEIFTDYHAPRFYLGCGGVLVEDAPFNLYFNNFVPNEEVLVALYYRSESGSFDLLSTWNGLIDENGKLVQHIEQPELFELGDYGIAVFGSQRRLVGFMASERLEASASLDLVAKQGPPPLPPLVSQATITPLPPTEEPQETEEPDQGAWFPCPGSYASRLHVGDRAYVSYDPPLANRLRSTPDKDFGAILGSVEPGEDVKIKDGPVCANGWVWWYVREMETGSFGWTAEGDTENYWLVPFP